CLAVDVLLALWCCLALDQFSRSIITYVMAAPVISISSDVLVESMGSSFARVILIGSNSVEVSVAPEVGATVVVSPVEVLELDTHSSSEVDPSESSPPPIFVAPMVSPFLCSNDSESDNKIPDKHVSPTTSIPDIPTAPILPAPSAIVVPSSEALTTRKSVKPLSSHRLVLRYSSHNLDHFTSRSSSSHSSSNHSSSGHSISGHSLSRHTPPDTTDADSSTPLRFVHLSLARTPQCSEAYLCWRSTPLSTMYPLTTSESSAGNSSFESSAIPSCKRCRSPASIVTLPIQAIRALVPSRADLLLPRKRFKDYISPEDSNEEDIDIDVLEDIKADVTVVEVAVDRDVKARIDAGIDREVDVEVDVEDKVKDEVKSSERGTMEVGVDVVAGIDIPDGMLMPDVVERLEQVEEGLQNIYDHVIELPLQRIEDIKTGQRELESRSLITNVERASLLETMTIIRSGMTPEAIEELVNRRVEEALATYEATHAANALEAKIQSQNGSDGDNGNGGNGNGGDGNGGNGNPNENNRDARPVAWECTYQDFMKCQPLDFKGMEGVVRLIRWFEKMETVFHINNCPEKYQVKYATCTLLNSALTWWNSHKRTVGTDAAFAMSWRELMKLMVEVYCPRNEIQKIESELWNLTMKNNDLAAYTQRFQELTMMCTKMVLEEEDRVEKFIGGLPDNIQGNVIAAEPTKLQDAVRIANNLIDQKLKGYAVKNVEKKRRLEVNQRDNLGQQPPFKRPNVGGQNMARAYMAGNNERKSYNGPLRLCNKRKRHHEGPCTRGQVVNQRVLTCFECGRQGHYKSDFPKLKDQNRRNEARNKNGVGEARGKAYVMGGGDANSDSNVVKGTFLLNNQYASMIFDSGADRIFERKDHTSKPVNKFS
ncbi:putative reverse transcriptase domain-containing protein, partial [Tanacetum coccineum]